MTDDPFFGPLPFRRVEYRGSRRGDGTAEVVVVADGVSRRLKRLVHHSPTGLEWGYAGSGPADLARSLLADFLGFDPHPVVYQQFKWLIIARLPSEASWTLDPAKLREVLRMIGTELGLSCLRCLDERQIREGTRDRPCPVCRPGAGGPDPLTRDAFEHEPDPRR